MSTTNLPPLPTAPPSPDWKVEVSARLRAHRSGRSRVPENQPALPGMEAAPSSVAARVAERYARVPSWREAMAAEAAARAAAEAAKPAAPPIQRARIPEPEPCDPSALPQLRSEIAAPPQQRTETPRRAKAAPAHREPDPQPYQPELIRYSVSADSLPAPRYAPAEARVPTHTRTQVSVLIEDPIEEALVEPTSPLPARVIEFPRELVAPRKARPRLALGPLLEEEKRDVQAPQAALFGDSGELRILEADPEPAPGRVARAEANVPEWHSIHLDNEEPMRESQAAAPTAFAADLPLHVAPIQDRVMSGVVDVALTLVAFLAFVLVFALCTTHPPTGKVALAGAGATLLAMWVLYQFIFFSLLSATPGMRYARIALCTFDDENPTQGAMRGRIAALLLSALPLGLGFIWAMFDEDGLSWHDRITQTYQRSYRGM